MSAVPQHLVKLAKRTALVSAIWTTLCAILIVGLQIASWLRNGVWDAYPLSVVISGAKFNAASSDKLGSKEQEIADWLLEIPTIVPLLIALALILGFYLWLSALEERGGCRSGA